MDKIDPVPEIFDRNVELMANPLPPRRNDPPPEVRERLLARSVVGSHYIFPNLAPVRGNWTLALAGREECAPEYVVDRDRYPFHVIEYVAQGRGAVRLGRGREQKIGPGSVFAYSPDMKIRMRSDPEAPLVKFFFALAGKDVARRLAGARLRPGVIRRFGVPAEVLTIAEDIIHEGQRYGAHAPAICLKLIELLLLKIADGTSESSGGDEQARGNFLRCRALIDARAESLRSLAEISDVVRLDAASICRLFRRFQGTSPYQYLLRRKMSLAAGLLIDTRGLVKEVAERVGFVDPYHFARCFKLVHGVTPTELRRYRIGAGVAGRPLDTQDDPATRR